MPTTRMPCGGRPVPLNAPPVLACELVTNG
jgi:hypothetical protein